MDLPLQQIWVYCNAEHEKHEKHERHEVTMNYMKDENEECKARLAFLERQAQGLHSFSEQALIGDRQ